MVNERNISERNKKGRSGFLSRIVLLIIVLVLLPCIIVLIFNFTKLVALGNMNVEQFFDSFAKYSYQPVFDFYYNLWEEIRAFANELKPWLRERFEALKK